MQNTLIQRVYLRDDLFKEDACGLALAANKCKSCGQVFFPKVIYCFSCLCDEMEEITLSRRGKLITYTIGRMAPPPFKAPHAIGYLQLPEGVMVFAPLEMVEAKPFKIGMEMEIEIGKLYQEGDKEVIGYKFKPV
jgi:uncharacterized OB-fold protein